MNDERSRVLGIEINALSFTEMLQRCVNSIRMRGNLVLGMINVAKLVKMQSDSELRGAVTGCDLLIADGLPVVWVSKFSKVSLPERITGIDLFVRLLELADREGFSVYLLGAKRDVLDRMVEIVRTSYPGARIAGYRDGYFGESDEDEIVNEIRSAEPDMLFLGISSPKKEFFLAKWGRSLKVPICHGVGGSFDVLAGKVTRAPLFMQRLGLEWFYRVLQEPRRMWKRYLVTNTQFLILLIQEALGLRRFK